MHHRRKVADVWDVRGGPLFSRSVGTLTVCARDASTYAESLGVEGIYSLQECPCMVIIGYSIQLYDHVAHLTKPVRCPSFRKRKIEVACYFGIPDTSRNAARWSRSSSTYQTLSPLD